jgi:hypothetical protein
MSPPTLCDGGRRSDSIDFCVRNICTMEMVPEGVLWPVVTASGLSQRFPHNVDWPRGAGCGPSELEYREWYGSPWDVADDAAAWWGWVLGNQDWDTVCKVALDQGLNEEGFCDWRLGVLEACRIALRDDPRAHTISSWISAHIGFPQVIPSLASIIDGGCTPDPTRDLLLVDLPQGGGSNASFLNHLLRKAFPRRCQIRELLRFVSSYWAQSSELEWYVRCAAFSSIGGFYAHHRPESVLKLSQRRKLYNLCFRSGPGSLESWMVGEAPTNVIAKQYTLLMILQDNAIAAVAQLPTLSDAYANVMNWETFKINVDATTTRARLNFSETLELACATIGPKQDCRRHPPLYDNLFLVCENESKLVSFLITTGLIASSKTPDDWATAISTSGVFSHGNDVFPDKTLTGWGKRSSLYDFIRRIHLAGGDMCSPFQCWAGRGFGCEDLRATTLQRLSQEHPNDFTIFCVIFWVFVARGALSISQLPVQVRTRQVAALSKRFESCQVVPPSAGALMLCVFCGCVKNPVAFTAVPQSNRKRAPPGFGAGAIVYDDDRICLKCNTSTRNTTSRKLPDAARLLSAALCMTAPIVTISLVGRIANIKGQLYVLCPKCGCIAIVQASSVDYLTCEFCTPKPIASCVICQRTVPVGGTTFPSNWSGNHLMVYGGHTPGVLSTGRACAACSRSVVTRRRRKFAGTNVICS